MSPIAAVPAVRSSPRDILFPPKATDAVPAVAGFHENTNLIDKGRHCVSEATREG